MHQWRSVELDAQCPWFIVQVVPPATLVSTTVSSQTQRSSTFGQLARLNGIGSTEVSQPVSVGVKKRMQTASLGQLVVEQSSCVQ